MEVLEDFDGHHDGVAAAADIFGDFDDAAAVVFLEIEEELFAFGDDFLCHERRRILPLVAVAAAGATGAACVWPIAFFAAGLI